MRILMIEDEPELLSALKWGFEEKGYAVDTAETGPGGLELALTNGYDVVILDLNLPGMDGLTVLREIRRESLEQKVLILSARTSFHERIEGLDGGASDYLVKPFDFGELEARVRSLTRRAFIHQNAVLRFGGVTLDTVKRSAETAAGVPLELPQKELALLEYMMLNAGRPVSAEELIEHIWADDAGLFTNAVKVRVSLLRKKLTESGCGVTVSNLRGAGYFLAEEGGAGT